MNHKESLFFVGECLTLNLYPERIDKIRNIIRSGRVKWEQLVWVSSDHLVLPALYLNVKGAGLLPDLPEDLIDHLEEITSLNRNRNLEIIKQAKEITSLLNKHNISPIFLKGTAHLLSGLYKDIAERMVGDIDFLVAEKDLIIAGEILIEEGYVSLGFGKFDPDTLSITKHYPRLKNENYVSAVEIHRQPIEIPWDKNFNYELIEKSKKRINIGVDAFIPSCEHQILHNLLNVQLNDKAFIMTKIYLRQMYDLLLLSNSINPLDTIKEYGHYFTPLNSNLALSYTLLGNPKQISYLKNKRTKFYLAILFFFRKLSNQYKMIRVVVYYAWRFYRYPKVIIQSFYSRAHRKALYNRLSNPAWYKEHLLSYKKMS